MTQWQDRVQLETPWDFTLDQIGDMTIAIFGFEPIDTQYGPGFLCPANLLDGDKVVHEGVNVLVSGQVVNKHVTDWLNHAQHSEKDYPVLVRAHYIKSKSTAGYYWVLSNPDWEPS